MSEIKHPAVDVQLERDISLERVFAEESFQMLTTFAMSHTAEVDSTLVTYPMTDRCDMSTSDDKEIALRLRGVPTFSPSTPDWAHTVPDAKYYVMELQQGELDDEIEVPVDEDFSWQPYLQIIINTENLDDISVVDASTGKDLDFEDIVKALFILKAMREELRGMQFEEEVADVDVRPEYSSMVKKFVEFVSEEHIELYSCDDCGTENIPCLHTLEALN